MDWINSLPPQTKKPSYYWAVAKGSVIILQRSGKMSIWGFGGDKIDKTKVELWGSRIDFPDTWSPSGPEEDGWYCAQYEDGSCGVVRVALGQRTHCYDFDIPHEIEVKKIAKWNGPLKAPPLPSV